MPAQTRADERLAGLGRAAAGLRADVIRMLETAGSGHPGGSLSALDFLAVLYLGGHLAVDPARPAAPDRDRFILSKGHCAPALYAVLAAMGFFPKEELATLRKLGSRLQGHPDPRFLPLVEAATGSLGQGLSIAAGLALAAKLDKASWKVVCMTGDGEVQEGQVWEAAMSAPKLGLDNLTWVVDCNQVQQEGLTRSQMDIEPLRAKLEAFNWRVWELDGHDLAAIDRTLAEAAGTAGRPKALISRTVKGKGVSFMELKPAWHGKAPGPGEAAAALEELEGPPGARA